MLAMNDNSVQPRSNATKPVDDQIHIPLQFSHRILGIGAQHHQPATRPGNHCLERIRGLPVMQHHRHIIVLERCAQLLERFGCPLGIGARVLGDQFKIETANQVAEMITQAYHTEVIRIGEARFACGAELEQALLERCQVGVDCRLGLGARRTRSAAITSAMRPMLLLESHG